MSIEKNMIVARRLYTLWHSIRSHLDVVYCPILLFSHHLMFTVHCWFL